MLDTIRQFIAGIGTKKPDAAFEEVDQKLAASALLFHIVAIDGMVSPEERLMLADVLMRRFGLDYDSTETLIREAERVEKESVDLYGFTSVLKRQLDEADRERVVEMMWELVYADGTVHAFEDNVIWRVAELLAVPAAVRMRLKQEVRHRAKS
jgi:uncharacterized tellurite resistance protein B-like protein